MDKKKKKFSAEQKEKIIQMFFEKVSLTQIGKEFNTATATISTYLAEWGVRVQQTKEERQKEEQEKIFKKYDSKKNEIIEKYCKEKKSLEIIKKEMGLAHEMLIKKLKLWGVEIDYSSNNYKVYDETFFEKIDSEEKAYWLGFLYADGCVQKVEKEDKNKRKLKKSTISLELAEKDKEHLKLFAKTICLNFEESMLYSRERKIFYEHLNEERTYKMNNFIVHSKKIAEDLIKLGCVPNKSLILKFPTKEQVPEDLIHHFIRGYFDGDGWVVADKDDNIKLGIIGTEEFLNEIENFFIKIFDWYKPTKRSKTGQAKVLTKGIKTNTKLFIDKFYENAELFLERKYNIFLNSMPSRAENK